MDTAQRNLAGDYTGDGWVGRWVVLRVGGQVGGGFQNICTHDPDPGERADAGGGAFSCQAI